MARFVVGMSGPKADLYSLRRLLAVADSLGMPGTSTVESNVSYIGVTCGEDEVSRWPGAAAAE